MTQEQPAHLTEEAINDVLIGLASPQSKAHLAACSDCSNQIKGFHLGMKAFNQTTLAWSEARPNETARPVLDARPRRVATSPFAWALAAVLMVAIGIPVWNHNHQSASSTASIQEMNQSSSATSDTEAQIAQDNELLRSVDVALNENEESPISEYHLLEAPHPRSRTRPELRKP
jgi:hypothetical protein